MTGVPDSQGSCSVTNAHVADAVWTKADAQADAHHRTELNRVSGALSTQVYNVKLIKC